MVATLVTALLTSLTPAFYAVSWKPWIRYMLAGCDVAVLIIVVKATSFWFGVPLSPGDQIHARWPQLISGWGPRTCPGDEMRNDVDRKVEAITRDILSRPVANVGFPVWMTSATTVTSTPSRGCWTSP